MSASTPGWHPDPQGRHQHRFWDGSTWTDQVSDAGVVSVDPLDGGAAPGVQAVQASDQTVFGAATPTPTPSPSEPVGPAGSTPGFGGIPPAAGGGAAFGGIPPAGGAGGPGFTGGSLPPGPSSPPPPSGSSKLPLVLGGAIVAVIVVVLAVLLLGGGGGGSGAGQFTVKVREDAPTVHKLQLKAGEAAFIKVDGKHLHRGFAMDKATYEKWRKGKYLEDSDSPKLDARDFFSDTKLDDSFDSFDTDSAANRYPGVPGEAVFLRGFFTGGKEYKRYEGKEISLPVPISGTYYVVIISTNGEQDAKLTVRTAKNPKVTKDLDTDEYTDLESDSGFYTDFFSEATDQADSGS